MPQWVLLREINYTAKCAVRHQAKQLRPPRIVLFPNSQISDSSDGIEDIYFWGLDLLDFGENCLELVIAV